MTRTTTPSRVRSTGRHRSQRHAAAHVAQYIHELSDRHAQGRRSPAAAALPATRIAYTGATR
jgi:hypothetical protein